MTAPSVSQTPETRLARMALYLPQVPPAPIGAFANLRQHRGLLYISGQGPVLPDGRLMQGKVGDTVTAEEAREHARLVAINILTVVKTHFGSLNSVCGVVKLLGMVNATPDFERHPFVIDGASELLHQVFGGRGVHARSSFGVASLPNRITVEIEAILELSDDV
jgi:enamine deaminase RidA (YjgF/YER057c/UK114 family)